MNKMIINNSAQQFVARRFAAVAGAVLLFPGAILVAQQRDASSTSADKSVKNAVAIEQLITREPRQDAVTETDPAFPVISPDCCDDLSEICECTCLIRREIRRIRQEFGSECGAVDKSVDFGDDVAKNNVDNLRTSIVGYLKTILAELRGEAGQASCSEVCAKDGTNCDSSSKCVASTIDSENTCREVA